MDKFDVVRLIGEGGYGVVYKCRSKDTGDIVAIKKIKHSITGDPRKVGLREIRILTSLKHPNINQFLGAFKSKDRLYLVLECIEKTILDVLNENPNGIASQKCRSYTYQLASALQYCHVRSIVHRDVKPENLLVNEKDIIKLCDFGFARYLPNSKNAAISCDDEVDNFNAPTEFHQLTVYVATRWYRPPELILRLPYGKPVDVWPIGCILVEMATGEPLFCGDTDIDQLYQITNAVGPFTSDQMEAMLASPKFQFLTNNSSSVPTKKNSLQRFQRLLGEQMFDILVKCVNNDPNKRITVDACASHPGFELERRNGVPPQNALNKLSQILNPKAANRNRRLDWVKYVCDNESPGNSTLESARSGGHLSKEEEMLLDAEVDLEKQRDIDESKTPTFKNYNVKQQSPASDDDASSSTSHKSQKRQSLPFESSAFPIIHRNTTPCISTNPYTLQRSYTWYKSPLIPAPGEDRNKTFLTKLLARGTQGIQLQHSPSHPITTPDADSRTRKPRQRTMTIDLTRGTIQPQFIVAKSDVVKWDVLSRQNTKEFSNTPVQTSLKQVPMKTRSDGSDSRLLEPK